tara:strand:+ start:33972 stop:35852 length:1881 start_codon:yes stop_codon:yes gene_type:complete
MKKVLFIERLDFITIFFAIIFRPFFNIIKFRTGNKFFEKVHIHKYLKLFSIDPIWIVKENNHIFHKAFEEGWLIEEKFVNNQLKSNFFVKKFEEYYKLNQSQKLKLYLSIRNEFFTDADTLPNTSIKIIKELFPEGSHKVYFIPYLFSTSILLNELNQKNIKIFNFICVLRVFGFVGKIFFITLNFLKNKLIKFTKIKNKNNKINNNQKLSNYFVAYLPHQNLKYADFFKKTYLYENDKTSPLYKEKILTIFFKETDSVSKRYLNRYKIPNINYKNFINFSKTFFEFLVNIRNLISIEFLKEFRSLNRIFIFFLFFKFRMHIMNHINFLNKLESLKVVYIHYDILCPQSFILACNIKGITTISCQERPSTYTWMSPLIYDTYLTIGDGFSKMFEKLGYPSKFIPIGLPRSHYIKKQPNDAVKMKLKKFLDIKKNKKIVVCFGLAVDNTKIMHRYGDIAGSSAASIIHFTEAMYFLAKNFQNLYFILRFKRLSELFDVLPKKLQEEIENKDNIEIQKSLKKYNSYDLATISDLIIGKGTSILEESLSAGKKIILYDNEGYVTSKDYPLNETNLISTDLPSLKNRVKDIIDGKYDEPQKIEKFTNEYYRSKSDKNGFDLIKDAIIQSL